MGAVAVALQERGFKVTGSDENVYPPMSSFLENKGIALMEGYRAKNHPGGCGRGGDRQRDEAWQPGSAGRATTTALLAWIMEKARRKPGYVIGSAFERAGENIVGEPVQPF